MIFKTIRSQLLFITTAPIVFIVLAISLSFLFDSLEDADRGMDSRGKNLSEQITLLSEFYFYTGNRDELEKIAQLIMKSQSIDFIRFSDKNYNALVFLQKDQYKDSQIFNTTVYNKGANLDDFTNLTGNEKKEDALGNITFGLSKDAMLSKKKRIYKRILIVALLAIIGGLCLAYLFSRQLLSGLNSLRFSAAKIEAKKFDRRCNENASGELLKIQQVFNNMADSIQQNEKILQGRIYFSTKSLNETINELSRKNIELDKTREQAISLERSKAIADERTRIMKDMHDGIGGQLVASLALIEKEENSTIRESISEILFGCLDDFRLIINSLNTSTNVLSALLADFKYRMSKRLESMGIQLHWEIDDSIDHLYLQPQQALHILRILQEAFSNILKHAQASSLRCQSAHVGEDIVISIEDNGSFFSPNSQGGGQGLKNIKWRAEQLSAQVKIGKTSVGGCKLTLSIPKARFSTENNQ
ncbi:MAG: signal transduction histidine kinase [Cellvibrionaceae bacterium]|jgi:signal transduction histidine kinase